jgi:hypothetical protein
MSAASVATDLAFFTGATGNSSCDAYNSGDWTLTNVSPVLDTDYMIENTGCLSAKLAKSGTTLMTAVFISNATVDLTNKSVFIWLLCLTPAILDTKAAGGIRLRIEDASANYGEVYVDGSDTYLGGWQCYCLNSNTAYNVNSATKPNVAAIKKIGWTIKQTAAANKTNFFWDAFRYGTGLTLTLGDTTTPGTLENFYTYDNASKLGVIRKYKGIYLVQGGGGTTRPLTIGSTGSAATYFYDSSGAVCVFLDNPAYTAPTGALGGVLYNNAATPAVLATPNGFKIVGNGSANTEAHFYSTVFKAESGRYRYYITASDTNITKFTFNGVGFQDSDTITGQAYHADKVFTGCTFTRCNRVELGTGLLTSCSFASAPGRALLIDSASHHMSSCTFQNCGTAIEFSTATTYAISSCVFSGNTIDVLNTSGGSVVVNATSCAGLSTDYTVLTANNKAQSYNATGTAYVDESTAAFNATLYDMNILSDSTPEVNDAYLFGNTAAPFLSILLRQEIAATFSGSAWVVTWEYSTGVGTWSALSGVSDGTSAFAVASPATKKVSWTAPGAGWVTATYNGITAYWVRARVSTYNTRTTSPKGSQVWLETTDDTTVNTTVTLTVTCKNSAGNAIDGVNVRIEKLSDGSLISSGTTSGGGIYTDSTYNYPGSDVAVKVIARMKGYTFNSLQTTIYNTGLSAAFTMIRDNAVDLP